MSNELVAAEQAVEKISGVASTLIKDAIDKANNLKFPNKEHYAEADSCYNELHRIWKTGEEQRTTFTGPLNEVLKKINSVFKSKLDPIDAAKKKLKERMDFYATEEMMWKRREEARIAAEKRKADAEALEKAAKLSEQGKENDADKIIEQAIANKPKEVVGATDLGTSTIKSVWKAEVINTKVFLYACADNPKYMEFLTIEQGALNRFAQRTKGFESIPGVFIKETAAAGAGR